MARTFGKDCPSVSLEDAIAKVKKVYEGGHRSLMSPEAVAANLGYASVSGASATMIANLKKYGLLEGRKGEIRVSDDAIAVLVFEDPKSADRIEALKRCEVQPPLFKELSEKFGTAVNETTLRIFLEKQGMKNKDAADAVQLYTETKEFVARESSGYTSPRAQNHRGKDDFSPPPLDERQGKPAVREITLPLPTGDWPTLRGQFPMHEIVWDQMMALLDAMKPGLVVPDSNKDADEVVPKGPPPTTKAEDLI